MGVGRETQEIGRGISNMDLKQIFTRIQNHHSAMLGKEHYRAFGILVPLIQIDGQIHLLFEVRSLQLKRQPGEICFPGGGVEKYDPTPQDTAIRETAEELGIEKDSISCVYPLDFFVQSMDGRIIYPYVGFIDNIEKIKPNPDEVKEIFTVPIEYLRDMKPEEHRLTFQVQLGEDFPYHLIPGGKNYSWKTREIVEYFYFYKDYVIWGLTANILRHFLSIVYEQDNGEKK